MTVQELVEADQDMLRISLTAEDVSRLAAVLPANEPLLDLIEVEMREQGFWIEPDLLTEVNDVEAA